MGDDKITDLAAFRDKIRDTIEANEAENDSLTGCPNCGDLLFMVSFLPEHTMVDEGGPYAIICQHCYEALGSAFIFDED